MSNQEEEYCVEVSGIFHVMDTSQENANDFIANQIEKYGYVDQLYIGEETDDLFEQFLNSLNLEDKSDYKLAERMKQFRDVFEFGEENEIDHMTKTLYLGIQMSKDEAIEFIGEVISSGAKTGFDKDYVYEAWQIILDIIKEKRR
jgi:hypothetical protein